MLHKIKIFFDVRKERKKLLFIVLVFFLLSFTISRIYSLNFSHYVYIKGYHIHHFYFGTASLFFGGILALLSNQHKRLQIAGALIGIGIGLFADEIGLLLNCTSENKLCSYYFPDITDIIVTIIVIIFFLIAIVDTEHYFFENNKKEEK
jgi:Na+/proline symporter